MIGYVTLGTNDLSRAAAFYDALLGEIGARRSVETDRMVLWGNKPGTALLGVITPIDGQPATVGNGVMVSLAARSRREVDALYHKALSLGAADEGVPGLRSDTFYVAYFRDLEGNKLACFYMG